MILFGTGWWLLIPCAALALAAALAAYRRSAFQLPLPWKAVLPALRMGVLFLCLALLMRPLWRHSSARQERPVLAVLADESLSIARHDSTLRSILRDLSSLRADVQLFGFSTATRVLGTADSLATNGVRTDIASALTSIQESLSTEHLRGILLLSDGQYNTGRNPLYVADHAPVPVHTMAIGDTAKQQDIQVRRVATSDNAYVGTEVPIEVSVMASGYENQQVTVALARGAAVVSTARVALPADGTVIPVRMGYIPDAAGVFQLTASVTRLEGEVTHANNQATVTMTVRDNRQRVLLVGGAPHPDLAAMRTFIEREEAREVTSLVQKDAQSFYEGTAPDSLASFDLIILVGFPGPTSSPILAQQLAASGTRLFFVLTRNTSLGLLRDAFGEALPVYPAQGRSLFGEAAFEITPEGRIHAILQDLPPISTLLLPPLQFNATRWQTSPDTRVLARASVGGVDVEGPLLAVRSRSGVRTAALLGAGTWRWQNLPEDLAASDGWWPALLANLLQWLLAPEDDRRVRIEPVQQAFAGGEAISFDGQVLDESLQGVDGASVVIDIIAPDGARYPYTLKGLGGGRYAADIGTLPQGSYTYEVSAQRAQAALGTDQGAFTVGALVLEFMETRANVPLLRQIASRSGGRFLAGNDADDVARVLRADSAFATKTSLDTTELPLWHWPLLLAFILSLLTAEWVLRKRIGLA